MQAGHEKVKTEKQYIAVAQAEQKLRPRVNAVNGDFSVGATGHWVKKGDLIHPVKQVTLAGNWLTVLSDIVQIGNDVDNFPIHGNIITPSVAIEKLNLAGL